MKNLTVSRYMTTTLHTIGAEQTLAKATEMMREYKVRHLPVLSGGHLVGIVTERDIQFLETFKDIDAEKIKLSEAYNEEVYVVSPKAPLKEVCAEMALHKFGSVLVMENNKLLGIFTWIDALHAFSEHLSLSQRPHSTLMAAK